MSVLFLISLSAMLSVVSCLIYCHSKQCIQPFMRLYKLFLITLLVIISMSALRMITYIPMLSLWLHRGEVMGLIVLTMISIAIVYDYLKIETNIGIKLIYVIETLLIGLCVTPLIIKGVDHSQQMLIGITGTLYYKVIFFVVTGIFSYLASQLLISVASDNNKSLKKLQGVCLLVAMISSFF